MPKSLSNKLQDLENEIHVMLTLQEPGKSCCSNVVKEAAITTHSGGNVDKVVFEGLGCQTTQSGKAIMSLPSSRPNSRPSSSPGAVRSKRRSSGSNEKSNADRGDARRACSGGCRRKGSFIDDDGCNCGPPKKPSPCICGARREAALKKCICGPGRSKKASLQGKGSVDRTETPGRPLQDGGSSVRGSFGFVGGAAGGVVGGAAGGAAGGATGGAAGSATGGVVGSSGGGTSEDTKAAQAVAKAREAELQELAKSREGDLKKMAECEEAMSKLQTELEKTQLLLNEAEHDKNMAMSMTNELREKYDKLRTGKSAEADELAKLKKEKEELVKKLDKEAELRRTLEEKAKETAEKDKKDLTEKVEKIEIHAAKSAKQVKKSSNTLAAAVHQKDGHIKRLSEATERLAESIREKEFENKRLSDAHKEMLQNLIDAQATNKKLADTNTVLVKNAKEFQEKYQSERSSVQKLQKQIEECKDEFRKCSEEMERLRERLKQALQGPKDIREMLKLQNKLREVRERERKWLDEQAYLEAKMKELLENQGNQSKQSDDELERMIKEHKKLQSKFEELTKKLQFTIEEHQAKIANMEEEFQAYSKEMQAKEDKLTREMQELRNDFDNLTEASNRDRQVLEDLIARTQQQDMVIRLQQEAITCRDEQIMKDRMEIGQLNDQLAEMEDHISTLQNTIETTELALQGSRLEAGTLTNQLKDVREEIVKKDKALAEHISKVEELNATVMDRESKLQSVMEEARIISEEIMRTTEENKSFSAQLTAEKEEKVTVIQQVNSDKSDIKEKVAKLENTVENFCKCAGDNKQRKLISSLEQKMVLLEKENNLQMQLVLKQKDQALNAARFATQKLLETVGDFQNQVETHKKVQYMLTKMLHEKEEHLKKMCPKRCPKPKSARVAKSSCGNPTCSSARFADSD